MVVVCFFFFFFKQKTAYEISVRDWSSDVCSSDLNPGSEGSFAAASNSARICGSSNGPENTRRSEERRVGKECERLCISRWSADHEKKNSGRGTLPGCRLSAPVVLPHLRMR